MLGDPGGSAAARSQLPNITGSSGQPPTLVLLQFRFFQNSLVVYLCSGTWWWACELIPRRTGWRVRVTFPPSRQTKSAWVVLLGSTSLCLKGKGGETELFSTPVNSLQEISSLASQPLPIWPGGGWVGLQTEDLFGYLMVRPAWMCLELLRRCGDFSTSCFQLWALVEFKGNWKVPSGNLLHIHISSFIVLNWAFSFGWQFTHFLNSCVTFRMLRGALHNLCNHSSTDSYLGGFLIS